MNRVLTIAIIAAASGCAAAPAVEGALVLKNGIVWLGPDVPPAEAMALADGAVVYAGGNAGARAFEKGAAEIVDLGGAFVGPAFIDDHTHFLLGGRLLAGVQLGGATSREEFVRRIAEYAAANPGAWILDGNWDHEAWGGALPTRDWIDAATGTTPVFVGRTDGHMALANSEALRRAGIDEKTATPAGGEIVRDAAGRPTGVLKDEAMNLVTRIIPPLTDDQMLAAFSRAQDYALSNGVAEINDMAISTEPGLKELNIYRKARAAGLMKLRVNVFSPIVSWKELHADIAKNGPGDAQLCWNGVKGFVDGALGSTTAWFYEPFTDHPETSGFPVANLDALKENIRGADAAGLHVTVHAIGDRANDWLLGVYEEIGGADIRAKRFRIEHAQHLTPAAIEKFAALGVIASMQPYHAVDDGRWAEKRIGAERIKTTYAFRSLLDAGAIVAFGSDWTVAPMNPIAGIDAAVNRRTLDGANPLGWVPDQKITVAEALGAYTAANAYAGMGPECLGSNARADFVVLSGDPRAVAAADLGSIKVLRTIIAGKTVYQRAEE